MNDLMTKSFTSYVDLKKSSMKDQDLEAGPDLDLQMQTIQQPDHNLTSFLQEAELVKQEMNSIRETLAHLQSANQESKTLHNPDALKSIRRRINGDIVTVLKKAKTIKSRLEEMDRANAESRRLSGCKMGTPVDRTRTAVANGLRKKLKELMMDFQGLRQRMMSEYKETVGRTYFTVTGEQPNEEVIEKIISNGTDGHGGEEFLSRAIQEHGRGKVLETVVEIQDRHDAAKEIERSLLELHQVFLDMAVMVEAQGEKMDDIEHHVMNAAHYVNDGTKNLKTAKGYQKSSRKCMCFGIILLLIIILVIIIPIITSFSKS
ncbi:syntaxin-related protein KNOLLE [Cynara cardunculus var. scolymus]|uniref:Syntaxin/epimorphin, conserved site-containing protein n=1 Tax=Cynara cardunculus var. scolymus TaxID=59895 RepID=A0A124SBP5_CYNCS|nr:syntaxin-related protein KNOLLE [Cynara cardunculus var. scolymus]KVH91300.1 Syntaxin/epimorphin, conserved site-containing protein [Cynara cardunculus var. scolymus]